MTSRPASSRIFTVRSPFFAQDRATRLVLCAETSRMPFPAPESRALLKGLRGMLAAGALLIGVPPLGAKDLANDTADHVFVSLDKAKLIKMPPHVDTVVVGNPSIADVTMVKKNGLMVVTGKGFGETNVIFLDPTGQALSEATVTVRTAQTLVTVQRGMDRESYSCAPRCEPAVSLGDATRYMTDTSSQITTRNGLVTPVQH